MAHSYGTLDDLYALGIAEDAVADVPDERKLKVLEATSAEADTALGLQATAPIPSPPMDFVADVCRVAAWEVLLVRGMTPGEDNEFENRAKEVRTKWREMVQGERAVYAGVSLADATPGVIEAAPLGWSEDPRGWDGPL